MVARLWVPPTIMTDNPQRQVRLVNPQSPTELEATREIFREYALSLGVDLCFQGFEAELAELPGDYAAPAGSLWLVQVDGVWAACCALRPLNAPGISEACEMKRMYVRPAFRGLGLGKLLATTVVQDGRRLGYERMYLDTMDQLTTARAIYQQLGFVEVPAYYHNPIPGVHYLKLELGA